MYIKIRVQWTYNDIHINHDRYTWYKNKYYTNKIRIIRINLQSTSDRDVLKTSKGTNLISNSMAFHSVGAAYINNRSNNELAHILLIGGTYNKQGSEDARVRIVVPITLNLMKSLKYSGAALLTVLCVKAKFKK